MSLVRPYVYLALVLAFAVVIGAAYLRGREHGRDSEQARQAREADIVATTRATALRTAADAIAQIQIKHSTIRQQMETQIVERPVYRDCAHTAGVLQLINAALAGSAPVAAGAGGVSAAGAVDR
jgi:hypothetical protein